MNTYAIYHEPKSKYAYAYDEETLHIRIRTAKNDIDTIALIAVDPFSWYPTKEDPKQYVFDYEQIQKLPMHKEYSNNLYDFWFIEVKDFKWLRVKYAFLLEKDGRKVLYGPYAETPYEEGSEKQGKVHNYFNFPFINKEDVYKAPEWASEMVWYQIFPERFARGKNDGVTGGQLPWDSVEQVDNDMFFGGNLQGIIEHLDYLQDLGITGIYFTPLFESPSSHKYDTTDYFKIDPQFGTNEKFKVLVDEAHKRGMKVMLDAVFNHCGYKHPYWQDVLAKGKDSVYYDYFHVLDTPITNFDLDQDGIPKPLNEEQYHSLAYRTFAFEPKMPKWNTANKDARAYLLSIAIYWIDTYGIDGWRLDVSNEVSHDFWRAFRQTVKQVKDDVYIIGENWDNSYPWLTGDQFDAVMNYELLYPIWNFVGNNTYSHQKMSVSAYRDTISTLLANYPKHVMQHMFNMLDSHDTPRLMTVCEEDIRKVNLAYVLQMTFAGAPSIYYGSELGISGEGDANRRCMPWQRVADDHPVKEHVKRMITIRKQLAATRSVDIEWLDLGSSHPVLVFTKQAQGEKLYVMMNNSQEVVSFKLPHHIVNKEVYDIYHEKVEVLEEEQILEPYSFRLYTKKV